MRTRRYKSSGDPVEGVHRSVLLHEAVDALALKSDAVVIDATLGGAGHAREIVGRLGSQGTFIGFDADPEAIERARNILRDVHAKTYFIHANFRELEDKVLALGVTGIDAALFDLGWSSYQLTGGRGFSFSVDEPLSMRYDPEGELTAQRIVNEWEESSLADVIYGWGDERYARRIAKRVVEAREREAITSSVQLADIIAAAVPPAYRRGKLHPATKTFQALRIAANDELGALETGLLSAWKLLRPKGHVAVISFHSLEDRIVKRRFMEWEKSGEGKRMTKKPLTASETELKENPRARSAKLRVIEKL